MGRHVQVGSSCGLQCQSLGNSVSAQHIYVVEHQVVRMGQGIAQISTLADAKTLGLKDRQVLRWADRWSTFRGGHHAWVLLVVLDSVH